MRIKKKRTCFKVALLQTYKQIKSEERESKIILSFYCVPDTVLVTSDKLIYLIF